MSSNVHFTMNSVTADVVRELKSVFKVNTDAEVLERALALALIAQRHADSENMIIIRGANEDEAKSESVQLAG